jgi:hypothetical protein
MLAKNIPLVLIAALGTSLAWAQEGGRIGDGPGVTPNKERSIPAETTAALVKDPKWKAPRTSWGAPSLDGQWSVDDMRGIPRDRPENQGTRESLTAEEFFKRASQQQGGKDRATKEETFLRNEWGTRTFGYTSLVVEPANGRVPALTAAGKARADAGAGVGTFGPGPFNKFEDFSLYDRCITRGIFGSVLPSIYGNGIRIVQSPAEISITYEMIHDTRVIHLDNRSHLDDSVEQYMGNAVGHWDGDTLVVETTNFTDLTSIGVNGGGPPNSEKLKLTERFKRVDPQMIEYRATIDDPVTFTAPFTYRVMFTAQPNYEVYEYSCHEGNGAVGHALSGERAFDKQVAEAQAKGLPPPKRANGLNIYRAPAEGSEVFDINAGQ